MKGKKLKLITLILAILVICLVSFVGVYTQNMNQMQNQVKGYDLTKDLKGYRELVFEVSDATEVLDAEGNVVGNTDSYSDETIESYSYEKTDTKVNADEDLNTENYQKAKSIIETRLKSLGVEDYNLSLNTENGTIYVQIPENSSTDHVVSNILQVSNFELRDAEDSSQVFMTNDDIKNVSALYNTTETGTTVYLQIEFTKNGRDTLKEISTGEYATKEESDTTESTDNTSNSTEEENVSESENTAETNETTDGSENNTTEETSNETTENTSSDGESEESTESTENDNTEEDTQKEIVLAIDENEMITTSFDTPIEDGIIDLSMNQETTDVDTITETLQSTSTIALLINSGKLPLTYRVTENNYINTDISEDMVQKVIYGIIILAIVALLFMIIKFKLKGFLAAIAYIGFVALDLLLIRYTNVSISIESIVAGVIILIINYGLIYQLLKVKETDAEQRKIQYRNQFKSAIMILVPIFIISIIFVFINLTKLNTFGMFMFWGILLSILYNYIVTKNMLD